MIVTLITTSLKRTTDRVSVLIKKHPYLFFLPLITALVYLLNPWIFLACAIFCLDFMASYVSMRFNLDVIVDFALVGVILFGLGKEFRYAAMIAIGHIIIRLILGKLQQKHLIHVPIYSVVYLVAGFMKASASAFFILVFLNLIIKMLFDTIIMGDARVLFKIQKIIHAVGTFAFLNIFGVALIAALGA